MCGYGLWTFFGGQRTVDKSGLAPIIIVTRHTSYHDELIVLLAFLALFFFMLSFFLHLFNIFYSWEDYTEVCN